MVDSFIETGICVCATEYEFHQLALEQNPWPYHGNWRVSVRIGHFTDYCETMLRTPLMCGLRRASYGLKIRERTWKIKEREEKEMKEKERKETHRGRIMVNKKVS